MAKNISNEDKKHIAIGRTIVTIKRLLFMLKFVICVSGISLIVLWLVKAPLWIAPIIGVGTYVVYRTLIRLLFRLIRKTYR